MALALDPATERRIQRELARGPYREPAELINHALDLLEDEGSWLLANRGTLDQRLRQSMREIERGEGIPGDQLRDVLKQKRSTP